MHSLLSSYRTLVGLTFVECDSTPSRTHFRGVESKIGTTMVQHIIFEYHGERSAIDGVVLRTGYFAL